MKLNKEKVIKYLTYLKNKIDCENDSYVEYQMELKILSNCIELLQELGE